jgi:nicotinamidase-related amidase
MSKAAVLVVDVQIGLVTGAYAEKEILENINQTIRRLRKSNGVVVFIQHCHSTYEPMMIGNSGWKLHPSLDVKDNDLFVEKEASDSFYETSLDDVLRANDIGHVYVTGLQTEFCVDTTCRSALSRGYSVTLVSDAHTTGDSHLSAAAIIDHHNKVLSNLAHPERKIDVKSSGEI